MNNNNTGDITNFHRCTIECYSHGADKQSKTHYKVTIQSAFDPETWNVQFSIVEHIQYIRTNKFNDRLEKSGNSFTENIDHMGTYDDFTNDLTASFPDCDSSEAFKAGYLHGFDLVLSYFSPPKVGRVLHFVEK